MTKSPWLMPTVSGVLAIALALTGAVIGSSLAAPDDTLVATGTAPATIIEPVSIGAPPAPDTETDPDAPLTVSRAVAERDVLLPTDSPELDPVVRELLDELGDAIDPAIAIILLDRESELEDAATDDDPCAPRTGDEAEDCPDGLMSTILGLTGIVEFRAGGHAWPPTRAEFLEHGNPAGGSLWCDADELGTAGGDDSLSQVPFGILGTAPGEFTVRYWPSERPGDVTVRSGILTGDDARAQYDEYLADPDNPLLYPLLRNCLTLHDLENDTVYTAVVSGVDIAGRTSSPHTVRFHSGGGTAHPGAKIITVGENLVLVSALHPPDQNVDIRTVVADLAEAGSTCSDLPFGTTLTPLTDVTVDADADELAANRAPPSFQKKHVASFAVPEGSTVLTCARWYAAGTAPSWQRDQPLFESSAILQAPDRVSPSMTLTDLAPYARGLERVRIAVSTVEGTMCGSFTWRPDNDRPLPALICTGEWSLRTGGARADGAGRLSDRGISGDLVVTLTSHYASGVETEARVVIASTDGGCRGDCALPPDAYYRVALPSVGQPAGLCGSGLGDCTPPTRSVSGGSVELMVAWGQGLSNGRASWNQTATVDFAPEYQVPVEPQFDLDERWSFDAPSFRPGYGNVTPFEWVTGRFTLSVDRPVDYEIRFTPEFRTGVAERCDTPGEPLIVQGRVEREAVVTMPGVCLRGAYYAEIDLTDDDGNTATWNLIDRTHFWGSGGVITAPGLEASIHYRIDAQTYGHSVLSQFRFSVGGWDARAVETRSGPCTSDGLVQSTGSFPVALGPTENVHLVIQLNQSSSWTPDSCSRILEEGELQTISVPVTLAELYGAETVVVTVPDPYNVRIILRVDRS